MHAIQTNVFPQQEGLQEGLQDRYEAYIYKLYYESKNSGRFADALACVIESHVHASATTKRVLYELLQNANEAPSLQRPQEVDIRIENGWLLFSHTGREFTDYDVSCLANAAKTSKPKSHYRPGHKGIGFKSLFCLSDCVYVLTPRYKFCFKKEHKEWRQYSTNAKFPWQICPIPVALEPTPQWLENWLEMLFQEEQSHTITIAAELRSAAEEEAFLRECRALATSAHLPYYLKNISSICIEGRPLADIAFYPLLQNDELGARAEEAVYDHLKARYAPVEELPMGFTSQKATVIWHRKYAEYLSQEERVRDSNTHRYYECDFTIRRKGKNEKRLEVKASRFGHEGIFSHKELELMMRAEEKNLCYKVYHFQHVHLPHDRWKWKKIESIRQVQLELPSFATQEAMLPTTVKDIRISFANVRQTTKSIQRSAYADTQ